MKRSTTSETRYFCVVDFEKLQHYKDRGPTWIKLYRKRLEEMDFLLLPDATKAHVMMIELLVAKMGNRLPFDPVFIAGQIGARDPVDLNLLLDRQFIALLDEQGGRRRAPASKPASKSASKRARPAIKEERSRDTETQNLSPLPSSARRIAGSARAADRQIENLVAELEARARATGLCGQLTKQQYRAWRRDARWRLRAGGPDGTVDAILAETQRRRDEAAEADRMRQAEAAAEAREKQLEQEFFARCGDVGFFEIVDACVAFAFKHPDEPFREAMKRWLRERGAPRAVHDFILADAIRKHHTQSEKRAGDEARQKGEAAAQAQPRPQLAAVPQLPPKLEGELFSAYTKRIAGDLAADRAPPVRMRGTAREEKADGGRDAERPSEATG